MTRRRLAVIPDLKSASSNPTRTKVAVILNGNAKAVDDRLVSDLRGLLQDEALYVSQTLEQSKFIARHIVNQGFDVVLCGGGDGTFTQVITDIMALTPQKVPAFGILRLGTGNAMAEVLGSGERGLRGLAADLRAARDPARRGPMSLLRSEGKLSPFVGVGIDAMILEDYLSTRRLLKPVLGKAFNGPLGYALAIASRTTWRLCTKPLPRITIRNEGAAAYRVDLRGRRLGKSIPRGGIIYQGPVTMAGASTIPYYGFRCKLFPQADKLSGRFQLRVGMASPSTMLSQVPAVFRGDFSSEQMWDYACAAISIHCEEGTPFQIGGDLQGTRHEIQIGIEELEASLGSSAALPCDDPAAPEGTPPLIKRAV